MEPMRRPGSRPDLCATSPVDAWERARWVWTAALVGLLALSAVFAAIDTDVSAARRWVAGLGAAATIAGFVLVVDRRPIDHAVGQVGGVAALIAAWMALTAVHPAFFAATLGLFPQFYLRLPLFRAFVATAVLAAGSMALQVLAEGDDPPWAVFAVLFVLTVGGAVFQGRWIGSIISQSAERRALIEQLEATRVELGEAERAAGQLEERQRLAAEIHDTLAQGFTSIAMLLEAVAAELPPDVPADVRRRLDLASATARDNLAEARRLISGLDPAPLDGASLVAAIRRLAATFSAETDIAAAVTIDGDAGDLVPGIDVAVLRATQEALANVRRHSGATAVEVRLGFAGDGVTLDVVDDGVGFDAGASPGHGLRGIRRRVEQVGGEVAIDARPGSGTHVRVTVP